MFASISWQNLKQLHLISFVFCKLCSQIFIHAVFCVQKQDASSASFLTTEFKRHGAFQLFLASFKVVPSVMCIKKCSFVFAN